MKTLARISKPGWLGKPVASINLRKLLNLRGATVATTARIARVGYILGTLCTILGLLFFAGVASAQGPHQSFSIPFHEVNRRILVDVEVHGHPATLLFDTGARVSALFRKAEFDCLLRMRRQGQFYCDGDVAVAFVKAEVQFDGFLGADIISKFALVSIDYTNHVIVFTEKP